VAENFAESAAAPPLRNPFRLTARWLAGRGRLSRFVLSALFGLLAVGALPPLYIVPLAVPAFVGFLWLLSGAPSGRAAFVVGWGFGLGYFAGGLYWVTEALLTDPEKFGWMVPLAVPVLAAGLALFIALAALATQLTRTGGVARVLVFAIAWTGAEWLRGAVLTGFPWNPIGSIWADTVVMLQSVSVFGVFGLGFITIAVAAMPTVLGEPVIGERGLRSWRPVLAALLVLGVIAIGGMVRLAGTELGYVQGIRLRLVQANISQVQKWRAARRSANFKKHLELTRAPGFAKITHVIWPESAVPYFLSRDLDRRLMIARAVPKGGLIVTGLTRRSAPGAGRRQFWNSLRAIDQTGRIVGTYDKAHLVPFGEYVPLRRFIPIPQIANGAEFSAGPGPQTLRLPGLPPVSPLICYEAIFPGAVVAPGPRPEWLLNITNDGWFGNSAGPYQHLAAARMRAVEEGLPMVRAANTGISAVFDSYGREIARLGLGKQGVLDVPLPRAIAGRTPFSRIGNWSLALLLALGWGLVLMFSRRQV